MKISYKIFLSIVLTAIISVTAVQLIQRYSFEQGFLAYAQEKRMDRLQLVTDELAQIYQQDGDWSRLQGQPDLSSVFILAKMRLSGTRAPEGIRSEQRAHQRGAHLGRYARRFRDITLLDPAGQLVAGSAVETEGVSKAIELDGQTIGYLQIGPLVSLSSEIDRQFSRQQNSGMLLSSLVILVVASIAAIVMSLHISRPINRLVGGVQALSKGKDIGKTNLKRADEIGTLSKAFDHLLDALELSRLQQRQWISDISHELRTPITILTGEIESIQDGYSALDLDALASIQMEVKRLELLVNDLHQLSLSDVGKMHYDFAPVDITQEVLNAIQSYDNQLNKRALSVERCMVAGQMIDGDVMRLRQLICNLIENSIRYTDSPGTIRLDGCQVDGFYRVTIEDSGPGVADEALGKIFNRLYRTDPSRSRETGASGLGLAICDAIIQAHSGSITARHSQLGGLAIDIDLPLTQVDPSV